MENRTHITRRAALAGGATVIAFPVLVARARTAARSPFAGHKDAAILEAERRAAEIDEECRRLDTSTEAGEKILNRLADEQVDCFYTVGRTPAHTLDGMAAKVRLINREFGLMEPDAWDTRAAETLLDDIRRLGRGGAS